jgi:hypothetical protein
LREGTSQLDEGAGVRAWALGGGDVPDEAGVEEGVVVGVGVWAGDVWVWLGDGLAGLAEVADRDGVGVREGLGEKDGVNVGDGATAGVAGVGAGFTAGSTVPAGTGTGRTRT